jgi:hypothetical protein
MWLLRTDFSKKIIASIRVERIGVLHFLVTANVSSSLILFTLEMEAMHSSKRSVLNKHHVTEGSILPSQSCEDLKRNITSLKRSHNFQTLK